MEPNHRKNLLNGWKEIADYMNRGVRTVQRWERELALPVRRPHGKSRSAVLALASELDGWVIRTPLVDPFHDQSMNRDSQHSAKRVLVVEDSVSDLNICVAVLRKMGTVEIDAVSSIAGALAHLEQVAVGKLPKPDVIVLDLIFGVESGFEVLRFRKTHVSLRDIKVIVWSAVANNQKLLCATFGIFNVVPKGAGARELEAAFLELPSFPPSASSTQI
jgi:CheY-like chemotaxis protein